MKNFTYFRPTTAEAAVALLEANRGNTEMLAGGTDLLALQKNYIAQPGRVVSLNAIAGLKTITVGANSASIGAGVTLAEIAAHADLRRLCPALTMAAGEIGGPQIRNMGTLGGNLCQRNRCWYFRDEHSPCLLRGGNRCSAVEGENKFHAIFTQNHRCVIASPSTLATGLIALGASAEVLGPQNRRRTVQMTNFFFAPVGPNDREHVLAANEMVTSVTIPVRGLNNAAYEVRQKQSSDWPIVQVAVSFTGGRNGEKATNTKIVLSHVAPTPLVADAAGRAVDNRAINDAVATAAGRAAVEGAKPLPQNGYKVRLVEVAVKRALMLAAGLPRYWEA
jgi:xanthine dehydrogenase YagS FAD-binding subunit